MLGNLESRLWITRLLTRVDELAPIKLTAPEIDATDAHHFLQTAV